MNDNGMAIDLGATANSYPDWDVEPIVEQVWKDLGETVPGADNAARRSQACPLAAALATISAPQCLVRSSDFSRLFTQKQPPRPSWRSTGYRIDMGRILLQGLNSLIAAAMVLSLALGLGFESIIGSARP